MFTEEEQSTGVGGVTVKDMWIAMQLLDKAASKGVVQPTEYAILSEWRNNVTSSIKRAVGKDYDEEVAKAYQAQLQQAQEQQRQAAEEFQDDQQEPETSPGKTQAKKVS